MNRLFLTLLALLTGFVAQVSPAQAVRAADEAQVSAVQVVRSAVRSARHVSFSVADDGSAFGTYRNEAAPLPRLHVAAPAVRVRIDRARE